MKFARLILAVLVGGAGPALAQGLPGLQKQVDALQAALQAQNTMLQNQIDFLTSLIGGVNTRINMVNTRIDNLTATPDDGTAAALVGTWTGSANDLQFSSSLTQFFFSLNGSGAPFFTVPQASSPLGPLLPPVNVGVNQQIWLGRGSVSGPITLTIDRTGMNLSGTGSNAGDPQSQPFSFSGIVLSNNLFLLRVVGNANGNCAPTGRVVFQGIGSLNAITNPPTPRRMTFTGSGIEGDCSHSFFRVALTKN